MKILYIHSTYLPDVGGIPILMHDLARKMVARGHQVTAIASRTLDFQPKDLPKEEYIDGVRVVRLNAYRVIPYKWLFFTPSIANAILREKADVVHVFSHLPMFITNVACFAARLSGCPLFITPSYNPYRHLSYSGVLAKTLMPVYDKVTGVAILKMASEVVTQTKAEYDFCKNHGIRNVNMLPVGLDLGAKAITVTAEDIAGFRQRFGLEGKKIVMAVGRIEKRKGFDLLVRAFRAVSSVYPEARLMIVGEDEGEFNAVSGLVKELGITDKVIFTGRVSDTDLDCAYEAADVVAQTSLYEAFCKIGLEAWRHSKPVIVFDKFAEPVTEKTGIPVKYLDVEAITQAINKLLDAPNLARELGRNGNRVLKESYDWDITIPRFEDAYLKYSTEKPA